MSGKRRENELVSEASHWIEAACSQAKRAGTEESVSIFIAAQFQYTISQNSVYWKRIVSPAPNTQPRVPGMRMLLAPVL